MWHECRPVFPQVGLVCNLVRFFAILVAVFILFGGVSFTMLAIKKLQGKEED
jgi:hypothetical protein